MQRRMLKCALPPFFALGLTTTLGFLASKCSTASYSEFVFEARVLKPKVSNYGIHVALLFYEAVHAPWRGPEWRGEGLSLHLESALGERQVMTSMLLRRYSLPKHEHPSTNASAPTSQIYLLRIASS
eukprot:365461-Chlamydomonas_euryale.AAC.3